MAVMRTKRVNLRLTEKEYQDLSSRVKKSTSNRISAYVRKVIFEKPITVLTRDQSLDEFMEELIRLRTELNALGNNFNQIVKKINSSPHHQALTYWIPIAQDLQKDLLAKTGHIQKRINEFSGVWLPL